MAQDTGRQEGTGSAENTNRDRSEQLNPMRELSEDQKNDISSQAGDNTPIADLKDLGQLSGRDDAAGGTGDDMENQSTSEATDR